VPVVCYRISIKQATYQHAYHCQYNTRS